MTYSNPDGSYTALSQIGDDASMLVMVDFLANGDRVRWDNDERIPDDIVVKTQTDLMMERLVPKLKESE
jgi:hypothetical protein